MTIGTRASLKGVSVYFCTECEQVFSLMKVYKFLAIFVCLFLLSACGVSGAMQTSTISKAPTTKTFTSSSQDGLITETTQTTQLATTLPQPVSTQSSTLELEPSSTADLRPVQHERTESGVIVAGPPDTFANCYKYQDEKAPQIINGWYAEEGEDPVHVAMFAGASAADSDQGILLISGPEDGACPEEGWEKYLTPFKGGYMEIIAEENFRLTLRVISSGCTIEFDIASRKFLSDSETAVP